MSQPPQGPPQGPPYGPPSGGPPSGGPPQGPPGGWGAPGPSPYGPGPEVSQGEARRGGAGKGLLIGGVAVAVLAVVGGGVWAATSFLGTGAQPAEALPADTVAYVSVDLDPSGGQKLEALRTLQKFPLFADNTDVGTDTDSDLKKAFFDGIQSSGEGCEGLDYDEDLAGWLGDRAAVGVLPGDDEPDVVGVVQVADPDEAEDGLASLASCAATSGADADAGGEDGGFDYVVDGDWAVIAETREIAQGAVDAAAESDLASDDDFDRWTEATGDAGIVAAYAAPGLADVLRDDLGADAPAELTDALEDFEGAALTVRFADEGVEVESAGYTGVSGAEGLLASDDVEGVLEGLPADSAAVLAVGLPEGWGDDVLEQISDLSGLSTDDLAAEAEEALGISVPGDLETLLGQGAALAASPDLDVEGLADGSTPPEELLAGLRITTDDPEAAEGVLDELRAALPDDSLVVSETDDDVLAVSPDDGYRSDLLGEGGLADDDTFTDAVPEAGRSAFVVYLDLDVVDDYSGLIDDISGDPRVSANLEPLAALGLSSWVEDDVPHSLLRLSTDPD